MAVKVFILLKLAAGFYAFGFSPLSPPRRENIIQMLKFPNVNFSPIPSRIQIKIDHEKK